MSPSAEVLTHEESGSQERVGADTETSAEEIGNQELQDRVDKGTASLSDSLSTIKEKSANLSSVNKGIGLDDAEFNRVIAESGIEQELAEISQSGEACVSRYSAETEAVLVGDEAAAQTEQDPEVPEATELDGKSGRPSPKRAEELYLLERTASIEEIKEAQQSVKDITTKLTESGLTAEEQGKDKELKKAKKRLDKATGLGLRYFSDRTTVDQIRGDTVDFLTSENVSPTTTEGAELKPGELFTDSEVSDRVRVIVETKIHELFGAEKRFDAEGKEVGSNNPEKEKILLEETARYLKLVSQAIVEGDIPRDISAADILALVQENVFVMAYQDRRAAESDLGDHGVRHISHNIRLCEEIFDKLDAGKEENDPTKVPAIDRLTAHQAMIMHDIGYATIPVAEGSRGADKSHNLLSAKIARERLEDETDPLGKIFTGDVADTLHEGILYHDSSEVAFDMEATSVEGRRSNVESAIHLADNMHAFESKLPEVLYSIPETLETMILLKSAAETGATPEEIEQIKGQLLGRIDEAEGLSEDDKQALKKAAGNLGGPSYDFNVSRMCGTEPKISIDQEGKVTITVIESAIHQETVRLFGVQEYKQFRKFIADNMGLEDDEDNPNPEITKALEESIIPGNPVHIELQLGANASKEKTDYEQRVEEIISDDEFSAWASGDLDDSAQQRTFEQLKKEATDTAEQERLEAFIIQIKARRTAKREQFIARKKNGGN